MWRTCQLRYTLSTFPTHADVSTNSPPERRKRCNLIEKHGNNVYGVLLLGVKYCLHYELHAKGLLQVFLNEIKGEQRCSVSLLVIA